MNIREMRLTLGDTQNEFAKRYNIPFRTVQNWETGMRKPPEYILNLLENQIKADLINRRTAFLPAYDSKKKNLPSRKDYIGSVSWLNAVKNCLGESVVFALDEALMCQGNFGGYSDVYIVWAYGDTTLAEYNGVVLLGNNVSEYCTSERNGLKFTNLSRTINDAFANEDILDMQGITEAVSKYYYKNGNSFEGISVAPEYQERFETLAREAIDYYTY